jgi:hypothetical protein
MQGHRFIIKGVFKTVRVKCDGSISLTGSGEMETPLKGCDSGLQRLNKNEQLADYTPVLGGL